MSLKHKLIDLALLPAAYAIGPVAWMMGKMAERAPHSRAALDRFNLGVVRHHYYEPTVRMSDLRGSLSAERVLPGLDLNEVGQFDLMAKMLYADELRAFPTLPQPTGFYYGNSNFGTGDAELFYDMVRHFKPRRIIEIGSGFSTRIAWAAVLANGREDADYVCEFTCIEPYEHAWLETLGPRIIRKCVETIDPAMFLDLAPNDILFIDSTHVIRPQGDVVHEYLRILPMIRSGVVVHVHDIFTPRDYPHEWIVNLRMMWDEQYLLEAFLSNNADFEVLCALNWMSHNHMNRLANAAPMLCADAGREPGSFWFRRR